MTDTEDRTQAFATVQDIGAMYRISRPTIYRLIERGEIEAVKVGRATRIAMASVERYFASLPRMTKAA